MSMTRYTICFDEEKDADILRWMDVQVNKSLSLKALVERSIAQEGYNDIFQLAWKRNIHNSTQMPDEPALPSTECDAQPPRRKRGRPRKNTSTLSASVSVIPKTEAAKQKNEHMQADPALMAQPDIHQSIHTAPSSTNNLETVTASEISAGQNKEYISDNQSAIPENQSLKPARDDTETENDGYQRPGNVNIDMTRFFG